MTLNFMNEKCCYCEHELFPCMEKIVVEFRRETLKIGCACYCVYVIAAPAGQAMQETSSSIQRSQV